MALMMVKGCVDALLWCFWSSATHPSRCCSLFSLPRIYCGDWSKDLARYQSRLVTRKALWIHCSLQVFFKETGFSRVSLQSARRNTHTHDPDRIKQSASSYALHVQRSLHKAM